MKESLLRTAWKIGSFRSKFEDVILLTGSPRSGTTWLLELVETLPRCRHIWEPFQTINELPLPGTPERPKKVKEANFGLGLRPYLPPDEDNPDLEKFLEKLFLGDLDLPMAMMRRGYRFNSSLEKFLFPVNLTFKRTIIKFCRAQRLLPWIQSRFPVRSILLIRHPLAVVASQLYHGGFQHESIEQEHPIISDQIKRDYPKLTNFSKELYYLEEKLTATWCFDYYIPLSNWAKCENTILITYESLVSTPSDVISDIEEHLDVKFPEKIYQNIRRPSTTTTQDSHVIKNDNPLTTWKDRLDETQINRILDVVRKFDIDFYSEKNSE